MSVKKGVVEWRDLVEFPEWEINSRGEVRSKMTLAVPEKRAVGAGFWYILTTKGKEHIRGPRALMRSTFPEVN